MEQLARVQLRSLPEVGIYLAAISDAYPGNGSSTPVSKPPEKEFQRSNIQIADNHHELHARISSRMRGDLSILSTSNYPIYDQVSRQPRSEAFADIKMVSLVNSRGTWTPAKSRNEDTLENSDLVQEEQIKNRNFYAPIGFAFFPFVVSCFGSFGPFAVRCFSPCNASSWSSSSSFAAVYPTCSPCFFFHERYCLCSFLYESLWGLELQQHHWI